MLSKPQFTAALANANICAPEQLVGVSEIEIARLERTLNLRLPQQYKTFLQSCGQGAGRFFTGTDMFFPGVEQLRNAAEALLQENHETFQLPADAVVFSMHQGYQFNYFHSSEGDDPAVYHYMEGEGLPVLTHESFSSFLLDAIEQHERIMSRRRI